MISLSKEEDISRLFSGYIKSVLLNERRKYYQMLSIKDSPVIYDDDFIDSLAADNSKALERASLADSIILEEFINDINLSQAMSILSPKEKRLIYMRFVEGKKDPQIAEELGVTSQAISKFRRRILRKLADNFY